MQLNISHRAQNIAPSPTLAIDARAKEMKAAGLDVVGFGAGEPDFPTPAHICDAAKEALDKGMTRYTPAAGTKELRKAICEKLRKDNDMTYIYGDILVSNGAKHSLYTIFQAILDPGDEVLIPTPCWVSYPEMVRMAGGVPVFIPSDESTNFIPTSKDIASRVTRRTKAIIITSPSNPNSIAQYAAMAALEGDQTCVDEMVAEFEKRRDVMVERINAIPGISCLKPQGAFYIMMTIKQLMGRTYHGRVLESSLDFAELLLAEQQVAVVPGVAFEAEGYCRLSYATSMEQINKGLDRIEAFVKSLD